MRTSFHHQPEAQHPNFQLLTSWQADYPIFRPIFRQARQAQLKQSNLSGRSLDGFKEIFATFQRDNLRRRF
jgi:hypothetical protein